MTLHEEQQKVQKAMNTTLSGLQADPWLTQRVLAEVKGEKPVGKKISTSLMVVAVLMILSVTAALAAGLGLFGKLSQVQDADERLAALEEQSGTLSVSLTTEDGITIEIGQAYYEGSRVFISYRLTGNLFSADLHEGSPEVNTQWTTQIENFIVADHWKNDVPELQKLNAWLDGRGRRWGTSFEASLHDGLFLEDGTYLDIIGGDQVIQEDGSVIGWKECEIPEERIADTLTFKAVLFRIHQVHFQDGSTYKSFVERGENTDIFFTLRQNDRFVYLKGSSVTDVYQAQAELASGQVDWKGTIRLTVPEAWVKIWNTWENEENLDIIMSWNLYQNGKPVSRTGVQSIRTEGTERMVFDLLYPHMDELEGLTLVPEYSRSGEHPEEAIMMERIVQ